jgi:hypothetical protein
MRRVISAPGAHMFVAPANLILADRLLTAAPYVAPEAGENYLWYRCPPETRLVIDGTPDGQAVARIELGGEQIEVIAWYVFCGIDPWEKP